jgi:hypothetical protein
MKTHHLLFLLFLPLLSHGQRKPEHDFSIKLQAENRFFFQPGLYDGQERNFLSIAVQPEYSFSWAEGKMLLKTTLFGRLDQYDTRRTHADIRELYVQTVRSNHEVSIGVKKVFWGVAESAHLVNVINQNDYVESIDGDEKLGQPMVHYSTWNNLGRFDFFYMPYFRKLTFPGEHGRLRTPFVIDDTMIAFESSHEEFRPDVAFRWSKYIGLFDIGVSHFYGTSRQPMISSWESFDPVYTVANQTGVDVQATTGPVLWKFEGVLNSNDVRNFGALVAGFEYTFGNVNKKGLDVGVLSEYLYDGRGTLAFSSLQHDLFVGCRLAFNNIQDTQLLAGGIVDLEYGTTLINLEASQRIGESWKVEIEGRFFTNVSDKEFLYVMREDSFLRLAINKYF